LSGPKTAGAGFAAVTFSENAWVASGETPLLAVITNPNLPLVPEGIVPERTPLFGSIDSHGGAPESEKVGLGKPVAVTG
jgi:hypothetical protein